MAAFVMALRSPDTQITLAGLPWTVHSPSLFSHNHPNGLICIGFNSVGWQIAARGSYGDMEWPSRDIAAQIVADSLTMVHVEHLA